MLSKQWNEQRWVGVLLLMLALGVALAATGCGGGMSSTPGANGSGPTAAQVRIGDAPADRVITFEVSVGPVTMTSTSGSTVTVLSGPRRLELTNVSATSEPLQLLNVPQGAYS